MILVHGIWGPHLDERPDKAGIKEDGQNYWSDYWGQYVTERLDWGGHHRIEEEVIEMIVEQAQDIVKRGVCDNGCIAITHSTGDLVLRYLLENQEDWLDEPLNILFSFDFAGSGGGTKLAEIAVQVALGGESLWNQKLSEYFFGVPSAVGVGFAGSLNDIKINAARSLGKSPSDVPSLRIAGTGLHPYFGIVTHFELPGVDDGVIALHSSCGAAFFGAYDSCSNFVSQDGVVGRYSAPERFYYNHWPFLMVDSNHSDIFANEDDVRLTTYVHNDLRFGNFNIYLEPKVSFAEEASGVDTILRETRTVRDSKVKSSIVMIREMIAPWVNFDLEPTIFDRPNPVSWSEETDDSENSDAESTDEVEESTPIASTVEIEKLVSKRPQAEEEATQSFRGAPAAAPTSARSVSSMVSLSVVRSSTIAKPSNQQAYLPRYVESRYVSRETVEEQDVYEAEAPAIEKAVDEVWVSGSHSEMAAPFETEPHSDVSDDVDPQTLESEVPLSNPEDTWWVSPHATIEVFDPYHILTE